MARGEKSVADEIWSFFGSGANLQELYITPNLMSDTMSDELARAAKWSRTNSDVLVDTHWIGGDPGKGEVYGWASWCPGKGILVLRNSSDQPQRFTTTPQAALELPEGVKDKLTLHAVYPRERPLATGAVAITQPVSLTLQPFEVMVMELSAMATP